MSERVAKFVGAWLTPSEHQRLMRLAQATGYSVSGVIRLLIRQAEVNRLYSEAGLKIYKGGKKW